MNIYALLAQSLVYPYEGLLGELRAGAAAAGKGPAQREFAAFLKGISRLGLAAWEELATRTLDLNPAAAPYVGFQVWGDSYQRGAFMAKLNRAEAELDIDPGGELPDHLVPVLRYLAAADPPLPELAEHLETALERMIAIVREKERGNPYVHVYEAALAAVQALPSSPTPQPPPCEGRGVSLPLAW